MYLWLKSSKKEMIMNKSLFTDLQKKMFTSDGNVKRYVYSDIIDDFKEGYSANISFPNGYGKGKRTYKDYCCTLALADIKAICVKVRDNMNNLRIRKITPKESWRLMGFDDQDFEKASLVNSDTQLYKQAGNSIVVNVLVEILKKLLKLK